ncbi:zonular occludens toxin domain-containing protein [Pseudoalteromonas sp. B5MOD-1]|uniref:zonular occludens toxin domain-containing protein n=1 Tax=Pseudoalteromonas sp. P80D2 TaxID=3113903 RepID=UPI002FC8C64E
MIHGISGKTGGGKSYEAVVRHIIPTVTEHKRKVVTNLPLNVEHFCSIYGEYCRDLIEVIDGEFHNYGGQRPFSKKEHYLQYEDWQNEEGNRVYFFVDECHLALPQQGTDKEVKQFYDMHRHYGFDIMLITQNFRKVDRDIRDLVANHYRAIKKSMMGQDDKYILKVHDGSSATNATVVATHEREYEAKYFKFYKSHTKSDQSVKEAAPSDIKKWYDNWFIKGSIVFFIVALFLLYLGFKKQSKIDETNTKLVSDSSVATQTSMPGQTPVPATNQILAQQAEIKELLAKQKKEQEAEEKKHPFYKVGLHIAGWAEYTELGKITKNYYLSASQNGQHIFELSLRDLVLAGYTVAVRSSCVIEIQYRKYHDFITCDSPKVGVFDEAPSEITE